MRKSILTIGLAIAGLFTATAQHSWCGTMDNLAELNKNNPNWEEDMYAHFEALDKTTPRESVLSKKGPAKIILPVVVHILHDNGQGNISYEQIQNGLDLLNIDMRRLNEDTSDARTEYAAIGADLEIEFRLASIDPAGDCTNGVVRKNVAGNTDGVTYDATDDAKRTTSGGDDAWPTDSYFNIWLVNTVRSSGGPGTVLGYAEFPFSGMGPTYGIIMRQDNWGVIGTAATTNLGGPRTITHEVGHCLNLLHTFQGGCGTSNCTNSGDRICDTPPTSEATYGCNENQNLCTNVPAGDYFGTDVNDMIENYMSYDGCTNLFSEGQKAAVWQAVQTYERFTALASPENLIATGAEATDLSLCSVEFTIDKTPLICEGEALTFTDVSYHNVTEVTWGFEGGSPATSNEKIPTVVYPTPGVYKVTQTVTNGTQTLTSVNESYVTVVEDNNFTAPFSENFQNVANLDEYNYSAGDPVNNRNFVINNNVGKGDSKCVWINNRVVPGDNVLDFFIRNIDTRNVTELDLNFDYAYAARSSASSDALKIYVSNDCGNSFGLRAQFKGSKLETAPESNSSFTPTADQWKESGLISLNNYIGESIQIRFTWESGAGNNFYLDNINLADPTGIQEFVRQDLNIFPNPAKNNVFVALPFSGEYTADIISIDGKLVKHITGVGSANETISLELNGVNPGLYLVHVYGENVEAIEKLMVD
ncbi:MAG: PKD repeat protein [Luteibaculaceae bacterium]|jgi:PKD repeat protein